MVSKIEVDTVVNQSGDQDSGIDLSSNDVVAVKTANTERMRVDASGNVLLGTTTTTAPFTLSTSGRAAVIHSSGTTNTQDLLNIVGNGNTTNNALRFWHGSNVAFSGGGVVGTVTINSSSTTYNTSSDYRLKENVVTDWDATTRLKQLKPSRFNFKIDKDRTVDGFLAHEVSSIVPEAITGEKDAVDKDGNPIHQGIDQSKLVPLLVKTIQELEARIVALESK